MWTQLISIRKCQNLWGDQCHFNLCGNGKLIDWGGGGHLLALKRRGEPQPNGLVGNLAPVEGLLWLRNKCTHPHQTRAVGLYIQVSTHICVLVEWETMQAHLQKITCFEFFMVNSCDVFGVLCFMQVEVARLVLFSGGSWPSCPVFRCALWTLGLVNKRLSDAPIWLST